MKHPPHPGRSIKIDCLDPLGLTVTEGAKVLGVARSTLSRVINGQASITPEMAIRLSKAFGSTPETWLKMQQAYDLAEMRTKEAEIAVARYLPKEPEEALV
jgi:addiction module HigA family antidote